MSNTSDSTYTADNNIPAHSAGTIIYYKITAAVKGVDTTRSKEMAYLVEPYFTLPFDEDFENADNLGSIGWSTQVTTGSMDWYLTSYSGDSFAEMSNFDGSTNNASETWLITPGIDLSSESEAYFGFENAFKWAGDSITVWASTNYNGDVTTATWDSLAPVELSTGSYTDVFSGYLDFSAYAGDTVHVAFKYTGSDSDGSTWQIDDVSAVASLNPIIGNTNISPENPTSDSTVSVTADITHEDPSGTIDTVYLAYGTTSGTLEDTIGMVNSTGDTYETETDIPAQNDSTEVFYEITAVDDQGNKTVTNEMSYLVLDPIYLTMPYEEDFESASSLGEIGWTTQVLTGNMDWAIASYDGDTYAEMSNYDGGNQASETWLITPGIDLSSESEAYFGFNNAFNYGGDSIKVYASANYDGLSDPTTADWDTLSPELSTGGWNDVFSGYLDFATYAGDTVHVAFKYTGTNSDGSTWQIDDVSAVTSSSLYPVISNMNISPANPTPSDAVTVSADVTHENPDGTIDTVYLAYGTTSGSLEDTIGMVHTSGDTYETKSDIPAQADGTEVFYEVTAMGNNGNSTTTNEMSYLVEVPAFVSVPLKEDFESTTDDELITNDLTNWMIHTPVGNQGWYGSVYSGNKYAEMSSYGTGEANETWLITPGIDQSDASGTEFTFDIAVGYWKHDGLSVMISEDFNGSDVAGATWTDITSNFTIPEEPTDGFGTLTSTDTMDISSYADTVYIAFKYTGDETNDETTTYQIDNVDIYDPSMPQINNTSINPANPTSTDDVDVSADVTISTGTIDTVYASWGTSSVTLDNTIGMINTGGDTYETESAIPAQADSTNVYYKITATSDGGSTATTEEMSYGVYDPVAVTLPFTEPFDSTDADLGQMSAYNNVGENQGWYYSSYEGTTYAKMSGFVDGTGAIKNEDWLITPPLDLSNVNEAKLSFTEAINYGGTIDEEQEVYVSTDYSGAGDPTSATWEKLPVTNRASGDSWIFVDVTPVDLTSYAGKSNVSIAFKYTSTTDNAATWEIDSIAVTEGAPANIAPEITSISQSPSDPGADVEVQINAMITDANPADTIEAVLKYGTAQDDLSQTAEFTNVGTGSDEDYAGVIPGQSAGTHIYYVIEATDGEATTTTDVRDYQIADETSIIDNEALSFEVYPNPSNGQFSIELDSKVADTYKVAVFNTVGKIVYQNEFGSHSVKQTINLTDQNDGIYFLKVTGKNTNKVIKLIKE
jgi:hypothetical protein